MHTLSLSEFRAHPSETMDLVQAGETVRIQRHGKTIGYVIAKLNEADEVPRWKKPFKTIQYARQPAKTGAQMIIEEREAGW